MKIHNADKLAEQFIRKDRIDLITKSLGNAAGSQRLYINIDIVPPKAFSTKYHTHSQQEEFFLILEGTGILRLNDKEHQVRKGDFFSKLPALNIAHTFYNFSDKPLVILDVGTVEKEDTCFYPDEGVYLHKSNGVSSIFREQSLIDDWTSEPN